MDVKEPPKLLDQIRQKIRYLHYSIKVVPDLRIAVDKTERYFDLDQKEAIDHVHLPDALSRK